MYHFTAPSAQDTTTASPATITWTSDCHVFARVHAAIQDAWGRADLTVIRQNTTAEMLSYFSQALSANQSQGVENRIKNVELISQSVESVWTEEDGMRYATVVLTWRAIDYLVNPTKREDEPGYIVEGDPKTPTEAREAWTFMMAPGGSWILSAIEQIEE